MRRVLIPIDGSDCALRGVALVARRSLREPEDLDVHLVNVQAPFTRDISRFASHEQSPLLTEESDKLMRDSSCRVNYVTRGRQCCRDDRQSCRSCSANRSSWVPMVAARLELLFLARSSIHWQLFRT